MQTLDGRRRSKFEKAYSNNGNPIPKWAFINFSEGNTITGSPKHVDPVTYGTTIIGLQENNIDGQDLPLSIRGDKTTMNKYALPIGKIISFTRLKHGVATGTRQEDRITLGIQW